MCISSYGKEHAWVWLTLLAKLFNVDSVTWYLYDLLPPKGVYDQLNKIWAILGTPTEATWPGVTKLPEYKPCKWPENEGSGVLCCHYVLCGKLSKEWYWNGICLNAKLLWMACYSVAFCRSLQEVWYSQRTGLSLTNVSFVTPHHFVTCTPNILNLVTHISYPLCMSNIDVWQKQKHSHVLVIEDNLCIIM